MSAIPPTWLSSIIQTQSGAERASDARQKENAAATERASGDSFAKSLQNVIEESDADSQVFSDAEGSGSQGRPSDPDEEEKAATRDPVPPPEGNHLDLQA